MKAVVHQPQYFAYPGFFHKLSMADIYVVMDDTQYDKRFTNRNKIIASNGWTWLTVPINKKQKFFQNRYVEINNDLPWREKHWKKIYHSYANAKYFSLYRDYFRNLYDREWNSLFDLNFETLKKTVEWIGLKIDIVRESELKVSGTSTERLVNACKAVGAETYISGKGGKDYMDIKLFEKNNIKVECQTYNPIRYSQRLSEGFVPNLSIIDMLANIGPESLKLIVESGKNLVQMQVSPHKS